MMKTYRFLLAAGVMLALAFTFSCSDSGGGGNNPGGGSSSSGGGGPDGGGNSSSGGGGGGYTGPYGSVNDAAGKSYKTVQIGTQTWMAENLNYDPGTGNSACYDNDLANCTIYGRLYDWSTAMGLPSSCNDNSCSSQIQSKHRGVCPSGWHLPSQAEWNTLSSFVQSTSGCTGCDAKLLKATSGWNDGERTSGNGTNQYGVPALPGGIGLSDGNFYDAGYIGYWWSASESNSNGAYLRRMYYNYEYAGWYYSSKSVLFSVRCLQD